MKKTKIISMIFIFVIIFSSFSTICFAELGSGFDSSKIARDGIESPYASPIKKVWGTVLLVMQVASVAGIIIMGARYIFASSNERANIKGTTIYAIIGIVMVFAFSTVVQYLISVTKDVLQ